MTMKIAIVGSRKYTNKRKIQDFIFHLKKQFGDELEIVSGGQKYGADGYAKKFALEFDVKYSEFPPSHYPHNMYCVRPKHRYGLPYPGKWSYHKRNEEIVDYCDKLVAFCPDGKVSSGTKSALTLCERGKKKYIIIK